MMLFPIVDPVILILHYYFIVLVSVNLFEHPTFYSRPEYDSYQTE